MEQGDYVHMMLNASDVRGELSLELWLSVRSHPSSGEERMVSPSASKG